MVLIRNLCKMFHIIQWSLYNVSVSFSLCCVWIYLRYVWCDRVDEERYRSVQIGKSSAHEPRTTKFFVGNSFFESKIEFFFHRTLTRATRVRIIWLESTANCNNSQKFFMHFNFFPWKKRKNRNSHSLECTCNRNVRLAVLFSLSLSFASQSIENLEIDSFLG